MAAIRFAVDFDFWKAVRKPFKERDHGFPFVHVLGLPFQGAQRRRLQDVGFGAFRKAGIAGVTGPGGIGADRGLEQTTREVGVGRRAIPPHPHQDVRPRQVCRHQEPGYQIVVRPTDNLDLRIVRRRFGDGVVGLALGDGEYEIVKPLDAQSPIEKMMNDRPAV